MPHKARRKKASIVAALLLVIISITAVLYPRSWVEPLAKYQARAYGLEIPRFGETSLGSGYLAIEDLELRAEWGDINVQGLRVSASFSQLLDGGVDSVAIEEISLIPSAGEQSEGSGTGLDMLTLVPGITDIPIEELTIGQGRVFPAGLDARDTPTQQPAVEFAAGAERGLDRFSATLRLNSLVQTTPLTVSLQLDRQDAAANRYYYTGSTRLSLNELETDLALSLDVDNATQVLTARLSADLDAGFLGRVLPGTLANQVEIPGPVAFTVAAEIGARGEAADWQLQANVTPAIPPQLQLLPGVTLAPVPGSSPGQGINFLLKAQASGPTPYPFSFQASLPALDLSYSSSNMRAGIRSPVTELAGHCEAPGQCSATLPLMLDLLRFEGNQLEIMSASFRGDLELGLEGESSTAEFLNSRLALEGLELPGLELRSSATWLASDSMASWHAEEAGFSGSFQLMTENLALSQSGRALVDPALELQGDFHTLQGGELSLEALLQGMPVASASASLDASTGAAELLLTMGPLTFSEQRRLSDLVTGDASSFDILAGTISLESRLQFQDTGAPGSVPGSMTGPVQGRVENLSGFINDTGFIGFFTEFEGSVFTAVGQAGDGDDDSFPVQIRSNGLQTASIATVDPGLPVSGVSFQYLINSAEKNFQVTDGNVSLLGGQVSVAEFDYRADRPDNRLDLVLASLDIASIIALADYPGVEADGLISGYLPIRIRDGVPTIEQGLVGALKPGGTIRYTPATGSPSANQTVQLVNDALSNYQYRILDSHVYYDEDGELLLEVQMRGRNPDMNDVQAINLNINISDNIPTLLRSLQASRVIEESLERRIQQRQSTPQ